MILRMSLQFSKSLPNNLAFAISGHTSMRELAEIDAISQNFINLLHVVTLHSAMGAGGSGLQSHLLLLLRQTTATISPGRHHVVIHLLGDITKIGWSICNFFVVRRFASFSELELTILTKQFIATLALQRLIWELIANSALYFFNHFSLKLILDFVHLDIKGWNRFRTHQLLDRSIRNHQLLSLLYWKTFFFCIHFLLERMVLPLHGIHLLDWHYFFNEKRSNI